MFDSTPLLLPRTGEHILVRSQGRIHFGLLEISEPQPNCFGGIGLMVEHSFATLQATLGSSSLEQCCIQADDYWRPRIEAVANQWSKTASDLPVQSIIVTESPLPHQGLGSGTQMACTVAALLTAAERLQLSGVSVFEMPLSALFTCDDPNFPGARQTYPMEALAKLSQRGKRSNIGLCGFMEGGFVLDHGKSIPAGSGAPSETRTERVAFPDWPVLIIQDSTSLGVSGNDEVAMFERCSDCPNPNQEAMLQLVQQKMLPAIAARDWTQFDVALGQYGRWAGQIFESVQGGIYRTPQIAATIDIAKRLGIEGATQSSWGPTVCAIAQDDAHASWCRDRLQRLLPGAIIVLTKAANHSAQVRWT